MRNRITLKKIHRLIFAPSLSLPATDITIILVKNTLKTSSRASLLARVFHVTFYGSISVLNSAKSFLNSLYKVPINYIYCKREELKANRLCQAPLTEHVPSKNSLVSLKRLFLTTQRFMLCCVCDSE